MNILIFGPNGSGKGTQGNLIKDKYNLAHIESGAIFREHIGGGTELGKKAKAYIDRGDLVPDDITIPMVLDTLKTKGANGWLLDGFPRNMVQAEKLWDALQKEGLKLDYVVEILLPREVAKNRIMGRRLCKNNNNHPNNIFIDAIKPNGDKCRVCGGDLSTRSDDQDEAAINKRHDIYYNTTDGTWMYRDDVSVESWLGTEDTLYFTSSTTPGRIWTWNEDSWATGTATTGTTKWVTPWNDLSAKSIVKGGFEVYLLCEVKTTAVTLNISLQTEKKTKTKTYTVNPLTSTEQSAGKSHKQKRIHFGGSGRRFRLIIETNKVAPYSAAPWRLISGLLIVSETDPD